MTKNVLSWCSSIKENEKDFFDLWQKKIDFESQILALFYTYPLHQFSKFNHFFWVHIVDF